MSARAWLVMITVLTRLPLMQAQQPPACVVRLTMDAHGRVYEQGNREQGNREQGNREQHHRLTHEALVHRLQAGCPAGSSPMQVVLQASPNAHYGAVKDLTDLVTRAGPSGTQFVLMLPKGGSAK